MRLTLTIPLLATTACAPQTGPGRGGPEPLSCAPGYLDDGGACVPEDCGVGTWGELAVDESTIFVDAAAPEGGDGSQAAPLTSIQAGLDLSGSRGGGMVAVASGTYVETLDLTRAHQGVQLAGRCRDRVVLDASGAADEVPGIDINTGGGEVLISGLTIAGASFSGVLVGSGELHIVDARVRDCAYGGLWVWRGNPTAPSSLQASRCEVVDNRVVGAVAEGAELSLHDCSIRDSWPSEDGLNGFGVYLLAGGSLSCERSVLAGNTGAGVWLQNAGTRVSLVDSEILDTGTSASQENGYGLILWDRAEAVVDGCVIARCTTGGIAASDAGSAITLLDTTVRDTRPSRDGEQGWGACVVEGASLWAESCDLVGNAHFGLVVQDHGTEAALRDTTIRDTVPASFGEWGFGVDVHSGATLTVEGCVLSDNSVVGLRAVNAGTAVQLRDTVIRGTLPDVVGGAGYGMQVALGAVLNAEGCVVERNMGVAVLAATQGTSVLLRDTAIIDTLRGSGELDAVALGAVSQDAALLEAEGLWVLGTEGPALYAVGDGTSLACSSCTILDSQFAGVAAVVGGHAELSASTISGTAQSANLGGGVGVFAEGAAPSLSVRSSVIADSAQAGVFLADSGSFVFDDNLILGSTGSPHGSTLRCGEGVYASSTEAWDGEVGLRLVGNVVQDNRGPGLLLDDGHALLEGNTWSDNDPDLLVQGAACEAPRDDYGDAPDSVICPEWDRPVCQLELSLSLLLQDVSAGMVPPPAPRLTFPLAPIRLER